LELDALFGSFRVRHEAAFLLLCGIFIRFGLGDGWVHGNRERLTSEHFFFHCLFILGMYLRDHDDDTWDLGEITRFRDVGI
jgi:hypothetical protein